MFASVKDAVNFIESRRTKHTVDEFRDVLRDLGINMKQPGMIHVGGTNGKGSTVNYLRAILQAHGYKVGTFTSPYLIKHNDRICINGQPMTDTDLLYYIGKYEHLIRAKDLSMFEIDVLIMLDYFEHQDLDFRIIECGIGGEHDKTNVIDPVMSAITNIGNDHLDQIGPSLYDVINEKMGIIKPGQTFVTSETRGTVLARLQEQCDAQGAVMVVVPEYADDHYPYRFSYRNMDFTLENQGIYQVTNARLALTMASKLIRLDDKLTVQAVEEAQWGGRFEVRRKNGVKVILDGAHNIEAMSALVKSLESMKIEHPAVVFAALGDKSTGDLLAILDSTTYPVYVTSFDDERYVSLKDQVVGNHMWYVKDLSKAFKRAAGKSDTVVFTGSLHFISAVRRWLDQTR